MSRAETLAGLTEAIAPHDDWRFNSDEAWSCRCGEPLIVPEGLVRPVHRAHVAAVALAWLEGHGWAQTVEEEWGVSRPELIDHNVINMGVRGVAEAVAKMSNRMASGRESHIVRRRVSAWAPVETGGAPDA